MLCRMLLVRPWQYDGYVGMKNTWAFHKDDNNLTLAPMMETELPKPKIWKGISLLTLKLFMEVTKTGMSLVMVERNGQVELEVPIEVWP